MPVTAVGKIFKPTLRQDATRRAIQSALAPLAQQGVEIEVEVLPHERHGMLTRISAGADTSVQGEALRARIEQLLSRFPGHREVIIH